MYKYDEDTTHVLPGSCTSALADTRSDCIRVLMIVMPRSGAYPLPNFLGIPHAKNRFKAMVAFVGPLLGSMSVREKDN